MVEQDGRVVDQVPVPLVQAEYDMKRILLGECGEVVGRCYATTSGPNPGESIASFVFIGVDAATLQNIRKWLRQEYARKKQAS